MQFLAFLFLQCLLSNASRSKINDWISIQFHEIESQDEPYYEIFDINCTENKCEINCQQVVDGFGILKVDIKLIFSIQSNSEFSFQIYFKDDNIWKLPNSKPYPKEFNKEKTDQEVESSTLFSNLNQKKDFMHIHHKPIFHIYLDEGTLNLKVHNQDDDIIELFNFKPKNKFLEFEGQFPTEHLFGFGERFSFFQMKPQVYTRWNKDVPSDISDPEEDFTETYGHHPTLLMKSKKNNFGIFFIKTSYPIEFELDRDLKFGMKILEPNPILKFFFSNCPEKVTADFHEYIGRWSIPAFWSFGFHQSKWGYRNTDVLEDVFDSFEIADMPIESIWLDLDYMDDRKVFTVDEFQFPIERTKQLLIDKDIKLVLLIDPGISSWPICTGSKEFYEPLFEGLKSDIFIKSLGANNSMINVLGRQWAGEVFYPDFTHPKISKYWTSMLSLLYSKLPFSGIWLDMNEIGHFTYGTHNITVEKISSIYTDTSNSWALSDEEMVLPTKLNKPLTTKTISLNSHYSNGATELSYHNFYGFSETIVTHESLKEILKTEQPFILTRSTAFGSGKYSSHWSGDVLSSFRQMYLSISSIFRFNLYGIPSVGADICGFTRNYNIDEAVEQLCGWWIKIGAFYPFARHHSEFAKDRREVSLLRGLEKKSAKEALMTRYSILRHIYTLFLKGNGKGTIYKPLFYNFPEDTMVYDFHILHSEFMIGEGLLFTPYIPKTNQRDNAYLPKNVNWYSFYNGSLINSLEMIPHSYSIETPIPIYIKEGIIFEMQTPELRSRNLGRFVSLTIALNRNHKAKGTIGLYGNYSEENEIHKYCVVKDCLSDVEISFNKERKSMIINFNPRDCINAKKILSKHKSSIISHFKFANLHELIESKHQIGKIAIIADIKVGENKKSFKLLKSFEDVVKIEKDFVKIKLVEDLKVSQFIEIEIKF